jgi:hypothetical protein
VKGSQPRNVGGNRRVFVSIKTIIRRYGTDLKLKGQIICERGPMDERQHVSFRRNDFIATLAAVVEILVGKQGS